MGWIGRRAVGWRRRRLARPENADRRSRLTTRHPSRSGRASSSRTGCWHAVSSSSTFSTPTAPTSPSPTSPKSLRASTRPTPPASFPLVSGHTLVEAVALALRSSTMMKRPRSASSPGTVLSAYVSPNSRDPSPDIHLCYRRASRPRSRRRPASSARSARTARRRCVCTP